MLFTSSQVNYVVSPKSMGGSQSDRGYLDLQISFDVLSPLAAVKAAFLFRLARAKPPAKIERVRVPGGSPEDAPRNNEPPVATARDTKPNDKTEKEQLIP